MATWNSMLHPRVPAGQAGGGKFAKGTGGSKAGGKGGKAGGAKGAAAQKSAETKQVYANLKGLTPQQRAEFLSKLSDPQLKALLHEASLGNSNDPVTRALLTAIKDQMAARSLTGAKGPTAINQAKAASAAKSAAGKQAAAAKKAATTQASAAKKSAAAATSSAKKQTTAQNTAARKQLASAKTAATAAAKAQKSAVANQAAALKAQAAMKAPTQAAKVSGLTSALKATTNPAQQQQILAQLKTALGLAQTARAAEVLALAVPATTSGDGPAVTINGAQRRVYAKKKIAMPDGSFPIPDKAHLRRAILAVGRAHPDKRDAVKAHIRRRATQLGVTPPAGAKKGT
jgi:hypothetical protein